MQNILKGVLLMTTNEIQNTTFAFRNKFEKFLNDENRPVITAAFAKFCSFNPGKAHAILWQFTYKPREVPFYFEELGLDMEQISDDFLPVLVSELRTQYKKMHPEFCKVAVPEELQEAFTTFINATNEIVAKHVYDRCNSKQYNPKEVEINLNKMINEKAFEETRVKAIQFFSFGQLEARYLYDYRSALHDLLEKMYELKLLILSKPFENMPFANLGNMLNDSGFNLADDSELPFVFGSKNESTAKDPTNPVENASPASAEESVQTDSGFKPLTSEEILAHKDVFASFVKNDDLNVLFQIGQLGFDLNQVAAKKEAISKLLKAAEKNDKAEADLIKATEKKEKAVANLLKAAEALSK